MNNDREPLVWLETGASLKEGEPLHVRVNLGHPILAEAVGRQQRSLFPSDTYADVTDAWEQIAIPEGDLRKMRATDGNGPEVEPASVALPDGSGFGDGRSLPVFAIGRTRLSALPMLGEPLRVIPCGDDSSENAETLAQVRIFLEMIVLGTTVQLASFLRGAMYIGPLRTIPPRGFLYERAGCVRSWANGLAAWDLLLSDRLTLVERTNHWLRRLGADCQIVVQQLFDPRADAEHLSDDCSLIRGLAHLSSHPKWARAFLKSFQ